MGDWTRYMPWRSPGSAVPVDACGIAAGYISGFPPPNPPPAGHQTGDLGSALPPRPAEWWQAGGVTNVSFGMLVNHGGGYQYRLCPKSADLTEECFQNMPLEFATSAHTIVFEDGSRPDLQIPALDTSRGTTPAGSRWRRNPIPAGNGDYGSGSGFQFQPPFEGGMGYVGFSFSIMDSLRVPEREGDYVLQWRWDCEQTPQVWNSCADISIHTQLPPYPTPAPTFAPTPVTHGGCCRFGSSCGDCGTDGTGWCHLSASNCAVCSGSFDSRARAPSCSGARKASLRSVRKHL